MDEFTQKVNRLIDQKLDSMSNMAVPNHTHNTYDSNQLDPAIALLGFPVIQASRGVLTIDTLIGGATYVAANDVATTGGTGTGLRVNTTVVAGAVTAVTISNAGSGYTIGDVITITGGNGAATFHVATITTAATAPTDTALNGTFRFYVDSSPAYRLWAFMVYLNASNVPVGAWKSVALT